MEKYATILKAQQRKRLEESRKSAYAFGVATWASFALLPQPLQIKKQKQTNPSKSRFFYGSEK
jgi:hypothetical protein